MVHIKGQWFTNWWPRVFQLDPIAQFGKEHTIHAVIKDLFNLISLPFFFIFKVGILETPMFSFCVFSLLFALKGLQR
jgi:hypothetical protein